MSILRTIFKKWSTTLVETIPQRCPRCYSDRFFRVARTDYDLRTNITRRYVCSSCSALTLFIGNADPDENEVHLLEPRELREHSAVSSIVVDAPLPSEQAEAQVIDYELASEAEAEEHAALRTELHTAELENNSQRKMLAEKEEEIANYRLQCDKQNREIQLLVSELKSARIRAESEKKAIQSKNEDLGRHLAAAQEAIRMNKEALLKARKIAYRASRQLKEQSEAY